MHVGSRLTLWKRPDARAFVDAAVQIKHLRFRTGPELLVLLALIWNFYWVWPMQACVAIFLTVGTATVTPTFLKKMCRQIVGRYKSVKVSSMGHSPN